MLLLDEKIQSHQPQWLSASTLGPNNRFKVGDTILPKANRLFVSAGYPSSFSDPPYEARTVAYQLTTILKKEFGVESNGYRSGLVCKLIRSAWLQQTNFGGPERGIFTSKYNWVNHPYVVDRISYVVCGTRVSDGSTRPWLENIRRVAVLHCGSHKYLSCDCEKVDT
jgi:hypothetical protein